MTTFKDAKGLQSVNAIKLAGADKYMGVSATVAAFDATAGVTLTRSLSNYSINAAVFDCTGTDAATIAAEVAGLWKALADLGIASVKYDGTNDA